jgi:hypothetical protein
VQARLAALLNLTPASSLGFMAAMAASAAIATYHHEGNQTMTPIITRDHLRTLTPSVFATTPWEGMSPRYRHIPTHEALDILDDGSRTFRD